MSPRQLSSFCAAALIALGLFAGGKGGGLLLSPAFAASADVLAGTASWYGRHWQGRKTASGTRFDADRLTAAHRSLPLNTKVRVTNLENAKSVTVLVNDRGPYVRGRVIDLSKAAARRLGMLKEGLAPVRIEVVKPAGQGAPAVAVAAQAAAERRSSDVDPLVAGSAIAAILLAAALAARRLRGTLLASTASDG